MRSLATAVFAIGLLVVTGSARAHHDDDGGDAHQTIFKVTLVGTAGGDFAVGSVGGSFLEIDSAAGGSVHMELADVTSAPGVPAVAAMNQLTIAGLVNGTAFTKTFLFDLVDGMGTVSDTLGLAPGDLLEVQLVTVANATGVFAVPGLRGADDGDDDGDNDDGHDGDHGDGDHGDGDHDDGDGGHDGDGHHGRGGGYDGGHDHNGHGSSGRHGGHDHLITAADRHGRDSRHGHGNCRRRHGRGGFAVSLVGDADTGDFTVDSTGGSFLEIKGEDGGKVEMRLAGVSDANGEAVDHTGNQLVIAGFRNGVAFTAMFPFDLEDGKGKARGTLELEDGDVVEIGMVTVTDGTTVFAVPGLFIADDDDGDGVPDGGDACNATTTNALVAGDGCSLGQRCACGPRRKMVRACLRHATKAVAASVRASCGKRKACRQALRRLEAERRLVIRSCAAAARN